MRKELEWKMWHRREFCWFSSFLWGYDVFRIKKFKVLFN